MGGAFGLAKFLVWQSLRALMRRVNMLIACLLLLAWMPASAHCGLAGAMSEISSECAATTDGEPCHGTPAGGGCEPCQMIQAGVNPSSLAAFVIGAPALHEIELLAEWLRSALRAAEGAPAEMAPPDSPPRGQLWIFVVRTALPVRGPSVLA